MKNILIALPENVNSSVKILKHVSSFIDSHKELDLNFSLKFHPDWPKERWKEKFEERWEQFFIENDSFDRIIFDKDLLVTSNGSTGLEAIACYIPAMVIESHENLAAPSIPAEIEQDVWKNCLTQKEFNNAIFYFMERNSNLLSRIESTGKRIRHNYFEPITREAVLRFLSIK